MATCLLTGPTPLGCKTVGGNNVGHGLTYSGVYLGAWQCGGASMTINYAANGSINSFTGSTVSFYQFCQQSEVASLTSVPVVNKENGTYTNEITLSFNIFNQTQTNQNTFNTLMQGQWQAIFVDNAGNFQFVGVTSPLNISDGSSGVGKMQDDLNGFTITMTTRDPLGIIQTAYAAVASVAINN